MDIDAIAEPTEQGGRVYVDILDGDPEDMSLLIGRHGQTLDAIQELVTPGRRPPPRQRIKVLVDVEDYRSAEPSGSWRRPGTRPRRALDTRQEQALEPMDALERKIAHDAVAEIEGVSTESRGEDPDRYVVVLPD